MRTFIYLLICFFYEKIRAISLQSGIRIRVKYSGLSIDTYP